MDAAQVLRSARRRSGLSLRQLGELGHTSHSALAAYESGRKVPTVATLDRIVRAAGFSLEASLLGRPSESVRDRGDELLEVLELAAQFPARHSPHLKYPKFGPRSAEK